MCMIDVAYLESGSWCSHDEWKRSQNLKKKLLVCIFGFNLMFEWNGIDDSR